MYSCENASSCRRVLVYIYIYIHLELPLPAGNEFMYVAIVYFMNIVRCCRATSISPRKLTEKKTRITNFKFNSCLNEFFSSVCGVDASTYTVYQLENALRAFKLWCLQCVRLTNNSIWKKKKNNIRIIIDDNWSTVGRSRISENENVFSSFYFKKLATLWYFVAVVWQRHSFSHFPSRGFFSIDYCADEPVNCTYQFILHLLLATVERNKVYFIWNEVSVQP